MTKEEFIFYKDEKGNKKVRKVETVEVEDKDGKTWTGTVYNTQRIDKDGFIRNVKAVDVDYEFINGEYVRKRTIEVSDKTRKLEILKSGIIFEYKD